MKRTVKDEQGYCLHPAQSITASAYAAAFTCGLATMSIVLPVIGTFCYWSLADYTLICCQIQVGPEKKEWVGTFGIDPVHSFTGVSFSDPLPNATLSFNNCTNPAG